MRTTSRTFKLSAVSVVVLWSSAVSAAPLYEFKKAQRGLVVTEVQSGSAPSSTEPQAPAPGPTGQQAFTTPGTYTWVAPPGVTSVHVVAVGGGGRAGGGLGWKNNIPVEPGMGYTVVVGAKAETTNIAGKDSYFIAPTLVKGGGAGQGNGSTAFTPGTFVGDGGGNGGGPGASFGGGGAGGYSGNGGDGAAGWGKPGLPGQGGGGGGGGVEGGGYGGGGGGVGLLGEGPSGEGGLGVAWKMGGKGGSGGQDGTSPVFTRGLGGLYGGGGAGGYDQVVGAGSGAVRIIWGLGRAFPSTNTADM